jgi:hypothetical protein
MATLRGLLAFGCAYLGTLAAAEPLDDLLEGISGAAARGEIACAYAPSHSDAVSRLSRALGGASALNAAVSSALGLKPSTRGPRILLTSSSDHAPPPALVSAVAAPALVDVALRVGPSLYEVQLLCVPRSSAKHYDRLMSVAEESSRRLGRYGDPYAKPVGGDASQPKPIARRVTVTARPLVGDVYTDAFKVPSTARTGLSAGP